MLYLVATPIGNLADITYRAIETLKQVDVIACEDTRQTVKLLKHYQINRPLISLHDQNERARTPALLRRLQDGEAVAVVSDGGSPLINDPGWWLVQKAKEKSIPMTWIPGASAVLGALVLSGLPVHRFAFEGFLPPKQGARLKRLEGLRAEERTIILFESPHRLVRLLKDMQRVFGGITVVCAKELTKLHESVIKDSVDQLIAGFEKSAPRGEFVVLFQPKENNG